jgi:hypothetical protein
MKIGPVEIDGPKPSSTSRRVRRLPKQSAPAGSACSYEPNLTVGAPEGGATCAVAARS